MEQRSPSHRFRAAPPRFGGGLAVILALVVLLAPPAWGSIDAKIMAAQGVQSYLLADYARAREMLAQAALLDSQDPSIQFSLGLCCLALKEYRQARQTFAQALSLNPHIPQGQLYLGISHYLLGEYPQAQASLSKARQQDAADGLTRYYLGLCALQMNQAQEASRELSQGARLQPEFAKYFQPFESLALVPSDVRPKTFRLAVNTGIEYDSNVPQIPDQLLYGFKPRKGVTHVDWGGRLGSRLEYYPVLRPDLNLGLRWNNYYIQHAWQDNWNWYNSRADLVLNYQTGPITWEPMAAFDHTLYSSERYSTMKIYGLTVDWFETKWLKGEITYRALNKHFLYDVGDEYYRTGWEHQAGFYQGILWPGVGAVRLGVAYERDLAQGQFIASWTVRNSVQGVFFLPWKVTAWAQLEFAYTNFDNYVEWLRQSRIDHVYQAQLLFKKPLWDKFSLWLGFAHVNNWSSMPSNKYHRTLVPILISYDFF